MKNLVLGLMILGLATPIYSQTTDVAYYESKSGSLFEESETTRPERNINSEYLEKTYSLNKNNELQPLEQKISNYDVSESYKFNKKNKKPFKIVFKTSKGKANVLYDSNGRIISSNESYTNVSLPQNVRNKIYKTYPDWTIKENTYIRSFSKSRDLNCFYRIKLIQDNKKRSVIIDSKGEFRMN